METMELSGMIACISVFLGVNTGVLLGSIFFRRFRY
nr:MAG TPA: hypothetical protein [Inoviridae sp.]